MTIESALTIKVSNPAYLAYIAEELEKRLKGQLQAKVQPKKDRVILVATVDSEKQLGAARMTVEAALRGVLQLLALDPLDQGKVTARII